MTRSDARPGEAAELRRRAEKLARERETRSPENLDVLSPEETRQTLHELRVHQIQLEMQNEELRRAQLELDASRARYFDLYDLAPVGYCTLSETGLILEANLTAATLLGIDRGALVGQLLSRFIFAGEQDTYYRLRKQLLESGEPQARELRVVKKDGTPFWARLEATVARDEGGAPICRIVMSDISERKRAEDQLRQLQKAESLGRMAGAVAHHYNNLLTVVMGNLELAMGDLPHDTGPAENLTGAMSAARRASEFGGLMLAYLGQSTVRREPLDLSEACRQCLPALRAGMPDNITFEAVLPSPGPAVSANADQIRLILGSLVANAREAMGDRRGAISVSVGKSSPADIPAVHRFPGEFQPETTDYACLEVRDDGCGIAETDIERIFEPFYSTRFTGRGLGLPLALGGVRGHDGCVTVESKPGRGSVFRVYLPLSSVPVSRPRAREPETTVTLESGTVLLVEDEETVRKMATTMLTRLGMTVLEARDGVEAVKVFRRHRDEIRCVLCNLTMPRMNGWEILEVLRRLAPGIPVILVSGSAEAHVGGSGHREQPQAFLGKPYGVAALRDTLAKAMRGDTA